MPINILTKEDLDQFKIELIQELKQLIPTNNNQPTIPKRWLRSYEVKQMLNISTGTLQTLRTKNTLNPRKIGGLHFYDTEEINKLLQKPNWRF